MSKRKPKYDGLEVHVPITADVEGPIRFRWEFFLSEAEVRAMADGHVPERLQDTCVGLLEWLELGEAPDSVPVGSSVGSRELFK